MKEDLKKYLKIQLKKAKKLGIDFIDDIQISPIKQKKYRVILNDGTKIDYGYFGKMKDGTMSKDFLEHKDENRRKRFWNRWRNHKDINNPYSPIFYFMRLTW